MRGLAHFLALCVLGLGLSQTAQAQSDSDAPSAATPAEAVLLDPAIAADVVARAVNHYLLPGYERFGVEAGLMDIVMGDLCHSRDAPRLEVARRQFGALALSWARVDFARFGPVMEDNRLERILFWPDRKSTGLKQVQAVLATKDETVADFVTLAKKSVALQGLGALEYVLFGTGADDLLSEAGNFRCRFGVAIAAGLGQTAQQISKAWDDPANVIAGLLQPSADHALYRSEAEALEAVIGVFPHGVEMLRDTRLLPFLGTDAKDAAPKSALLWRSGLAIPMIAASFKGMADYFEIAQFGNLLREDTRWLASSIQFEFANMARTLDAVSQPVEIAAADPALRGRLMYAVIVSRSLQRLIGEEMTGALGLSVGFSALDGD